MTKQAKETTRNYAHKAAMQKKMPALPIEVRGVSAQGRFFFFVFFSFCFFFVFVFEPTSPATIRQARDERATSPPVRKDGSADTMDALQSIQNRSYKRKK